MRSAPRISTRLDELAKCTDDPPRLTRTFLSPALRRAHELVGTWMREAGLAVRTDAIGNLVGRRESPVPGAKTLLLGSHLDTVRDAGRFDGALGVVLAIECAAALRDRPPPFSLEVIGFSDEEGVRFQSAYLGSRVLAGTLGAEALMLRDADGLTLVDAIEHWGSASSELAAEARKPESLLGYLEAHIEQGPVLQEQGLPVGVVTSISGQTRARIKFTGEAGHAGTVPMPLRHDALCGAAEFVVAVEKLARESPGLVATVGQLRTLPGASNVIPGEVELTLDVRHENDRVRDTACSQLRTAGEEIVERRGIGFEFETVQESSAVPCDLRLRRLLAETVSSQGMTVSELASGAGHDAVALAKICPVAMLFVRCRDGISHHPDEFAGEADIGIALQVLIGAVERLAQDCG